MISAMIYNSKEEEKEWIIQAVHKVAAYLTEEKWNIEYFDKREQVEAFIKNGNLLDFAGYDVTPVGSIDFLEKLRSHYRETVLFLIADPSLSPMEYVRPSILASSLILRPLTPQKLETCIREVLENLLEKNQGQEEEVLLIETREGKTYIPMSKIYYFEAREKRIYVRLKKQEFTFYETIEHLDKKLPAHFLRCHRSFIVNRYHIQKVMLSKNLIELEQGMSLPLSRSYKSVFKELV